MNRFLAISSITPLRAPSGASTTLPVRDWVVSAVSYVITQIARTMFDLRFPCASPKDATGFKCGVDMLRLIHSIPNGDSLRSKE